MVSKSLFAIAVGCYYKDIRQKELFQVENQIRIQDILACEHKKVKGKNINSLKMT